MERTSTSPSSDSEHDYAMSSSRHHPKSSFRHTAGARSIPHSTNTNTNTNTSTSTRRHKNNKKNNSFEWDDVQVTQNVTGMCGADKCFWRSTSDPENVGYLVASAGHHYHRMKKAYHFAVHVLEEKCHAKHLYLEPPTKVKVSPEFIRRKLNSLQHNEHREFLKEKKRAEGRDSLAERDIFDEDDTSVVVQKVQVAPTPNLMFGYTAGKWSMMVDQGIPKFRSELLLDQEGGKSNKSKSASVSLKQMKEKLKSERKGIDCAMQYGVTYWYDLQGLIDLEGNYHHLDVDSQFWMEVENENDDDDDDYDDDDDSVGSVSKVEAYAKRKSIIEKFNKMIQLLTNPVGEDNDDGDGDDDE